MVNAVESLLRMNVAPKIHPNRGDAADRNLDRAQLRSRLEACLAPAPAALI
jgi:hypothetical protein